MPSHRRRAVRVLVVDDEESVLGFLRLALDTLGCDVTCAGDSHSVTRLLREEQQFFDVAILDVCMPTASGFEVAEALRAHVPKLVFMSGYSPDSRLSIHPEALFLSKPLNLLELETIIESVRRTLSDADAGEDESC